MTMTASAEHPYDDPSVRYRCYYFAKELVRMGHFANVITKRQFEDNYEKISDYDVYIFHRPSLTMKFYDICRKLRKQNKILIANFDDFIFDVSAIKVMPRIKRGTVSFGACMDSVAKYFEGAAQCTYFMTSTDNLHEKISHVIGIDKCNVWTVHNGVPDEFVAISKLARMQQKHRKFTLGYFPGTASHDLDWAVFSQAIQDMKIDYPVDMLLLGPLKIDKINPSIRIVRHDYVRFEELPFLMAQCQTVLAPLEDTPFNRAKSGLKFWEAALCGCRVLATPIPDIDRFESPMLLKCRTAEDWQRNLDKVLHGEIPGATEQEIIRIEKQVHIRRETNRLIESLNNVFD
ncbi:hypothetical protein [uncultured Selenomonas sp.]|uniref:hypothetical protein n=1 Tax=uncultured Selenomonas sp. TaxID=159275 RepID=UPI0025D1E884|nr:hypothetical protein [uncultured Selenomonas sp.]